ncbi:MAG TPA: hypothetical protein PKA55_09375 [Rhodoblastus sp.]|nr:hypothetical protein [Rhodoblastus sp.]
MRTFAIIPVAVVALLSDLTAPARAWEVVSNGLPTFAAAESFKAGSGGALDQSAPLKFESVKGWNPGYDVRMGKYLFGMEQKTGFAAGGDMLGLASGFSFSGANMKFGYDMGAFKPYMSAAFAETRGPAFGANVFAAPPDAAMPFAFSAQATSVGAGFDYAITENLSFGMAVNATQVTGWRR